MIDRPSRPTPISPAVGRSGPESALPELEPQAFRDSFAALENAVGTRIVGHHDLVRLVVTTIVCGGHALVEGAPGLGKTLLVRSLAAAIDGVFSRVQFTPDLMPADILGTLMLQTTADGGRSFRFEPGPIFAHLVLADEVNRATPKTQSALLEAMQEGTVTVGKSTYQLPSPFFVLATQNPLEMEGTFPLPEAQLDRFSFKLEATFPPVEDLITIAERTTGGRQDGVRAVADVSRIQQMGALARDVPAAREVLDYGARLLRATHPGDPAAPAAVREHVRYGASPRGLQAMLLGAKVQALLDGRHHVGRADIRSVAMPALRHRLILDFMALAEGVAPDDVLAEVVRSVPE